MKKIMLVFGTRPEAIKMAPLAKELEKNKEFKTIVTVTAQHREMLDQVLDVFDIVPDYDLNIMKSQQTLDQITTKVLEGLSAVFDKVQPDMVLVHGDTSTTFVASLASFYKKIPIGHVEAGLRTWNKYSPFPEEANRQMTGVLADLHFSPTETAKGNLINEGKQEETIYVTGNTVIDALKTTVTPNYENDLLSKETKEKIILVTAHRRENIGENLENILKAIKKVVRDDKSVRVILPMHKNPIVRSEINKHLSEMDRVDLIEPLGVIDFHNIISKSYLILTDSGGIQEEAPSFGVPVLVLRDTTERPEGVQAGTLKLIGTNEDVIYKETLQLLNNQEEYKRMSSAENPYGDGLASVRIVDAIKRFFEL